MHILVSNDDGYFSQGLRTLVSRLKSDGHQVTVVAPDRNMSGCGQSLSLRRPINVRNIEENIFAVEGTPTDCVYLALHGLVEDEIDLVISGINHGANLGDDLLYSGTFAAAMEGRRLSLPNIAVSIISHQPKYLETAAFVVSKVVEELSTFPLKNDVSVLNINVPDLPIAELKGIKITSLGKRQISQAPKVERMLHGGLTYWIGLSGEFNQSNGNEDFLAVNQGYASLTPLSSQLVHKPFVNEVSDWLGEEFAGAEPENKKKAHEI